MAKRFGIKDAFVHGILDGRDVPPRTADIYAEAFEIKMADIGIGSIASLCGRFFAMDSGENWERTARAYTMLVHGEGERTRDVRTAIRSSFLRGISDEFIAPIVIENELGQPSGKILDGDAVIFFNHRPDTMRQLVRSVAMPGAGRRDAKAKNSRGVHDGIRRKLRIAGRFPERRRI
jgi:2,3-bisphosphoglycerate-independent phosphoglycerate mutase